MKVRIQGREQFEVDNKFYVNPDGWFKRTWCFTHQWANAGCNHYVIEADTIGDAIDTLLDSDFGKNFKISDEEIYQVKRDFLLRKGYCHNDVEERDDIDQIIIDDELSNDLMEFFEEKDWSCGGNDGALYDASQFINGAVRRCTIEDYKYEGDE